MESYFYAFLTEDGVCHTIIECNEERTDIAGPYLTIDSYELSLLDSRWTGSEWDHGPAEFGKAFWNGTEWEDLNPPVDLE